MSNYMNYSYNYNLRLIPKDKSINNFNPNALKKAKKNVLNVPMNNGGPIKLKTKELNKNNINRIIINKPKTPDLDNNINNYQYQQFNFNSNNHPRQSHNNFDNNIINKNGINDDNNAKYKRPSTAPQKNKNIKKKQKDSYDNRKKDNLYNNNQLYNLYNNKRLPSPLLKPKKELNKNKQMQQIKIKYRAPSPIISPNLVLSNMKRKKMINNEIYDYSQNDYN